MVYEFSRGITADGRVLDGIVLKHDMLLTAACEIVHIKSELPISRVHDLHPSGLPNDCPVCAIGADWIRFLPGLWRGDHIQCINGERIPLSELMYVFPATLGMAGISFDKLYLTRVNCNDYTTVSTANGLWLVPLVWAERYVDAWVA